MAYSNQWKSLMVAGDVDYTPKNVLLQVGDLRTLKLQNPVKLMA